MKTEKIYILHKNGAKGHYIALDHLLRQNNMQLVHREFSIFGNFFKSIIRLNRKLFIQQCKNTLFIVKLLFTKGEKVVLGIAPFDPKLLALKPLLKKHKLYYHTSWTCWDGSFHPKNKKNTAKVMANWRTFLEKDAEHIFSVTQKSKSELMENYSLSQNQISVVYHSLNPIFYTSNNHVQKRSLSFIYLGRLIPEKGIQELLDFFSIKNTAYLTIVGSGKEMEVIKNYAASHENITFQNYLTDKTEVVKLIAKHEYLVLNSKKTSKWEELFGLVIIESMAQGTIPIATHHSGPKEIIDENTGFLCEEGQISKIISHLIKKNNFDKTMSNNAIRASEFYHVDNIAKKWEAIL